MVGVVDPSSSSSASGNEQPAKPKDQQRPRRYLLQVRRPAGGRYSPKTDERCLTWCSQSSRGRAEGQEPLCRAICIRRVFAHEVQTLTSRYSGGTLETRKREDGVKEPDLKYPLPLEGQSRATDETGRPLRQNETRYWQEGWYIWMTKSRWAAQERMDLMMLDLERQTEWQKAKEEEIRSAGNRPQQPVERPFSSHENTNRTATLEHQGNETPPFSQAVEESFMVRIPTTLPPLAYYREKVISPTERLLGIVKKSFESGDQKELGRRLMETASSGAPFTLVKNVVKKLLDSSRSRRDGDDDDNNE